MGNKVTTAIRSKVKTKDRTTHSTNRIATNTTSSTTSSNPTTTVTSTTSSSNPSNNEIRHIITEETINNDTIKRELIEVKVSLIQLQNDYDTKNKILNFRTKLLQLIIIIFSIIILLILMYQQYNHHNHHNHHNEHLCHIENDNNIIKFKKQQNDHIGNIKSIEAIIITKEQFHNAMVSLFQSSSQVDQLWKHLENVSASVNGLQLLQLMSMFPKLSIGLLASSIGVMLSCLATGFLILILWPKSNENGRQLLLLVLFLFFFFTGRYMYYAKSDGSLEIPGIHYHHSSFTIIIHHSLFITVGGVMVSVSCVIFTILANMSLITYINRSALSLIKEPLYDIFATEFLPLELGLFLGTLAIYYLIPFAPLVMNLLILSNVMLLTLLKPYTVSSNYTVTVLGASSIVTWVLGLVLSEYGHFSINETNPTALLRSPGLWLEWSSMSIMLATFIWKYATKIHLVFIVALLVIVVPHYFAVVAGTGATLLMASSVTIGHFGILSFKVCFFAPPWREKDKYGRSGLIEPLINLFQNGILLIISVWMSNSMCMVVGILSIGFFLVRAGATYFTEPAIFVLYLSVLTLALLFWASSMS